MTEIPSSQQEELSNDSTTASSALSLWSNNTVIAALTAVLSQFIDIDYSSWIWRILWPLIVTFLLPLVFVMLIYLSSLFLYIYKLHRLVMSIYSALLYAVN